MVKFTIMAEYKPEPFAQWMQHHVDPLLKASTFTRRQGRWEGTPEDSFTLEVLVPGTLQDLHSSHYDLRHRKADIMRLAERYRLLAEQTEVWVTQEDVGVTRMTADGPVEA